MLESLGGDRVGVDFPSGQREINEVLFQPLDGENPIDTFKQSTLFAVI